MSSWMLHFSCNQLCSFIIPCAWDAFWQKSSFSSKGWEIHVLLHSTWMSTIWATNADSVFGSFLLPLGLPSQHLGTPVNFRDCPHTISKIRFEFWFQSHLSSSLECNVVARWSWAKAKPCGSVNRWWTLLGRDHYPPLHSWSLWSMTLLLFH